MTVGAVGGVGPQVAQPVSPQGKEAAQEVAPVVQEQQGTVEEAQAGESLVPGVPDQHFRPVAEKLSTKDFVSLTESMRGSDGNMKSIKEMIKVIMALQILEKTMEATADIIENVLGNGDKDTGSGRM